MRDILAHKVFGILPVEETKGDKSFTIYADGSYKAEMPINYKIALAKRPVLLLEKEVQARANHYLDALKDIKDKSVIKNLGGISLLPDGVVIDRIEKAFPEDSKGEGWYWTVACVLKLRPSSEEDAIIVQGAGVQIDIASTGNIMRLHSTVLPIMQPKKDDSFEILDLSDLSSNNIFREDNNQLQARGGTVNSVQNIILPKLKPLLFKHNASNGTYSPFTTTNEGDKALTRWGVEEKTDSNNGLGVNYKPSSIDILDDNCRLQRIGDMPWKGKGNIQTGELSVAIYFIADNDIFPDDVVQYSKDFIDEIAKTWSRYFINGIPVSLENIRSCLS